MDKLKINDDLQIDTSMKNEVLMIFKESKSSPAFTLQINEITYNNFIQTFESNKYLNVPRITSKSVFAELCPASLLDMKLK